MNVGKVKKILSELLDTDYCIQPKKVYFWLPDFGAVVAIPKLYKLDHGEAAGRSDRLSRDEHCLIRSKKDNRTRYITRSGQTP